MNQELGIRIDELDALHSKKIIPLRDYNFVNHFLLSQNFLILTDQNLQNFNKMIKQVKTAFLINFIRKFYLIDELSNVKKLILDVLIAINIRN